MRLISILMSAILTCFMACGSANADTRAVYTIANIPIDKTAANTREAEAEAFAEAKVIGFQRLIAKLTLPEDRNNLPGDFYSYSNANAFAAAVDVDNEKRSSTVYRADLSVVFNPTRVRAALDQAGVSYVDRQSSKSLLVPVASSVAATDAWRREWPDDNLSALNPFITATGFYDSASNWPDVSSEARSVGAQSAVIASLLGDAGNYRVRLVRDAGGGATTLGVTNAVSTLEEAVAAATAYLDVSWKRQSVIRSDEVTMSFAHIRYSNLRDWNEMRQALLSSPLVSDFQVEAVSIEGATVRFAFSGDQERLTSELRQRGIRVEGSASKLSLSKAFRRTR